MRALIINQAFVSPDEPGHTRHFELARFLGERGHELVIVGSDTNYQTGERVIRHQGISAEQRIEGVHVIRAASLPGLHRSYAWRVASFLLFMLNSLVVSARVPGVDLYLATTPPIFQTLPVWLLARLRRKPFLLEVRDLWPEFGIAMGVLRNPLLIGLSRALESFLYRRADHILVNSPAYTRYLVGRGVPPAKISCIPYGTDPEMFHPGEDGRVFRARYGLQGQFVVLYAGAMGQANDLATVLRAAGRLQAHPGIRFLLLGDGKLRPDLEREARRSGLDNVIFGGTVPKREMNTAIAAADACLAILQNIPMFRTTYPNKVFDYMAAGKPTVLVIDGVIRELLESAGGGVFVPPGDDRALADTLLALAADRRRLSKMGRRAREYVIAHMDRRDRMAETLELMKGMLRP